MPRAARIKSESGIYHIILRGINQQSVFENDDDKLKFIEILVKYKEVSEYKIFSYCLMGNHIHLLLKIEKEDIDLIVKRIAGSYAYWYNCKYYRRGHLFQDRFKSEPVDNESYLLTVIRYINQNPIKAGLCKKLDEFSFSSYNEFVKEKSEIIDTDFIYNIIEKKSLNEYMNESNNDECLDAEQVDFRISDIDAKKIVEKISHCKTIVEFQKLTIEKRDKYIKKLKEKGLSIRQISRLTGVSFGVVRKI